jgi:hypothetical protein
VSKRDENHCVQCVIRRVSDNAVDNRWVQGTPRRRGERYRWKVDGEVYEIVEPGAVWTTKRVLDYERDYVTMPTVTDAFPDGHGGHVTPGSR